MRLSDFNRAPAGAAAALVRTCANVDRWVDAVVTGRPYADIAALVAACHEVADPWTDAEIKTALARHPRIGDRAEGHRVDARLSRNEQAAVATAEAEVLAQLAEGNRAYEDKFGQVFLIRAAGRSASEILEQLRLRMANTPAQERQNVAHNLREIAALRLQGLIRE